MDNKQSINKKQCLICRKDLRKLTRTQEWDSRVYHITCWSNMIRDIKHFDKICYVKYGHRRLIDGKTIEEHKKSDDPIIVSFD